MISIDQLLAIKPIPGHEAPRWMPDGESIVFASGLGGGVDLWSIAPEGGCPVRRSVGMGTVGHLANFMFTPSPDGRFIAYVSQKSGAYEVWLWSAEGEPDRQLTRLGGAIESLAWSPDSAAVVISANRSGAYDIYRVDVPDGQTHRLTNHPLYEVYANFTADGKDILYVRLDERWVDHEIVRMRRDGANPRAIARDEDFFDYHYGRTLGYPMPSPDGTWVAFRSHRSGWITYWAVPADGGEARQLAPQEADQDGGAWSPDGAWFAYTSNRNGTVDLRVVPAGGGEPRVLVSPEMGVVSHPRWSPDGSRISVLLATPTSPNDLHVIDVGDGQVTCLTDSAVGATAGMLATPEKIAYPSFDGETIHAYLYRPRSIGVPANGAGILFVHGGPTSQFMDTFQPQVQFFVQRGYTLLLPNPRGSSGYGRRFEDLNNGDWGHGDLQDVIYGAEELKKLDDVDPDKMAITGTSYGGIMSMAAVAFAPGYFQAAIPMSGYGDFVHMKAEQELRHIKLLEYEFGALEENEEVYRRCSPIFAVTEATTPCFVIHGVGKYPRSAAGKEFALALEREYKTFKYKTYPGETYYVASTPNVRQMLLDMDGFFRLYLDLPAAPGGAAPAADFATGPASIPRDVAE
ncbi:MAG: prolyl oligopeptidase family serine peptidase [Thermomicrobiales bacterium]